MAEQVQTGGTMTFDYGGSRLRSELDPKRKKGIENAYLMAAQRRKKEKFEWMILLVVFVLLAFGGLVAFYFS